MYLERPSILYLKILTQLESSKITVNIFRISRPEMFCKKAVLRNFAKLTEKHLCQRLFFNTGVFL